LKVTLQNPIIESIGLTSTTVGFARDSTTGVRRLTHPQTPTAAQLRTREAFKNADTHWQQLAPTLKQSWRNYRRWQPMFGYNQFMRINIPLAIQGLPFIDDPANIP
jgi:hypothetical protein